MGKVDRFYGVRISTAANIAILLLILVLALIHLKSVIQPFIVAILLFFLMMILFLNLNINIHDWEIDIAD